MQVCQLTWYPRVYCQIWDQVNWLSVSAECIPLYHFNININMNLFNVLNMYNMVSKMLRVGHPWVYCYNICPYHLSIARGNSILWLGNTKLLYFSVNVVLFCLYPLLTQRPKQLTFGPCKLTTQCHRKKKRFFPDSYMTCCRPCIPSDLFGFRFKFSQCFLASASCFCLLIDDFMVPTVGAISHTGCCCGLL